MPHNWVSVSILLQRIGFYDSQNDCDQNGMVLYLIQMLFRQWVEHAETVIESGSHIPKDLPGEAEGNSKDVVHIVCCGAMGKIPCTVLHLPTVPVHTHAYSSWRLRRAAIDQHPILASRLSETGFLQW